MAPLLGADTACTPAILAGSQAVKTYPQRALLEITGGRAAAQGNCGTEHQSAMDRSWDGTFTVGFLPLAHSILVPSARSSTLSSSSDMWYVFVCRMNTKNPYMSRQQSSADGEHERRAQVSTAEHAPELQ